MLERRLVREVRGEAGNGEASLGFLTAVTLPAVLREEGPDRALLNSVRRTRFDGTQSKHGENREPPSPVAAGE